MSETDTPPLMGYEVLLCATGGIACYKAADLASKLVGAGAGVSVAMTEAATEFVGPATFQALTQRQVFTGLWTASEDYSAQHISLTERADLLVLAPATANMLAKMTAGIADDLVSTLCLSAHDACPILAAPAMNTRMWQAPPTQANVQRLRLWGVQLVGPNTGTLACRTSGPGRMAEPAEILDAATDLLKRKPPKSLATG